MQYETDLRNPPTIPDPAADANQSLDAPNAPKDEGGAPFGTFWGGWYTGANYSNQSPNKDYAGDPAYNKLVQPKDTNGPFQRTWKKSSVTSSSGQTLVTYDRESTFRNEAWDVEVKVTGTIDWANN